MLLHDVTKLITVYVASLALLPWASPVFGQTLQVGNPPAARDAQAAPAVKRPPVGQAPNAPAAGPQLQGGVPRMSVRPVGVPLNVISKDLFCQRLGQAFSNFAASNGIDHVHTALLATGATAEVVQEFRAGKASDYIKATSLRTIARLPNGPAEEGYLPLSGLIAQAMGLGSNVNLALSSGELRYIPSAQRGMDIVVIAQNAASLTPERLKKVAEIASNMQIHVSVIWVGGQESGEEIGDARLMAWLAANTGGSFANLGGTANPCGDVL